MMANYSPARSAVVVAAGFVVRMLLQVEQVTITLDQFANWCQARVDICALDILIAEVTSTIRKAAYREWTTSAEWQVKVENFFQLSVCIIAPDHQLCLSVLTLASRLGQSKACSGFYMVLAEPTASEL
jgi:predicted nucleic acid-binding protein